MTKAKTTINIGDHFEVHWGYDETRYDFYEVVGFTASGKSVRLREVPPRWLDDAHAIPEPGSFYNILGPDPTRADALTKRIIWSDYRNEDRLVPLVHFDYGTGQLWDGTPRYITPAHLGR